MSNSIPALFKTSLIAATVVSLSACSTTPNTEDYDLSRVGAGIMTAGRTTADVTSRAWDKTTYLLGFSEDDAEREEAGVRSDEGLLMDAEDVALLENGEALSRDTTIRPIAIRSATPNRKAQDQIPTTTQAAIETGPSARLEVPTDNNAVEPAQSELTAPEELIVESAAAQPAPAPVIEDMVHKVTSSETLWDIAKSITGDATNWHILADINNLGPNASVYPGQQLIIPADMITPSSSETASRETLIDEQAAIETTSPDSASGQVYVDTQDLTGRINDEASRSAIAQTEQNTPDARTELAEMEQLSQIGGKAFKLNPGETLWDFARRTTGDATNWQAIAGQNKFSAEQAAVVRTGQTIYVPEALIKSEPDADSLTAKSGLDTAASETSLTPEEAENVAAETSVEARPVQSADAAPQAGEKLRTLTITSQSVSAAKKADLLNGGEILLTEPRTTVQPIKIVEATFKTDETTPPIKQVKDALKSATSGPESQSPEQIMVSGTYYPKAIYNNADFSSSLLMRVSPGTTLQVAKAMGNWYQVKTSKGLGYVHQRDIK